MIKTIFEESAATKADQWRERIAEQKRSGLSVKQFCKQRGLTDYSFYTWRKRLGQQQPMRFALVETGSMRQQSATEALLELVLATGERLRISAGVDSKALRTVLEVLRA